MKFFFSKNFFYEHFFRKFFFTNIFFENFFYEHFFRKILFFPKIFFTNIFFYKFVFGENFYYFLFFFGENFSFHTNISAKICFTIFSRISSVFDVCEIMYYAKFFIHTFAYCEFFCFAILVYGKKIVKFFCDFFFSAMNVNTKFENVSFLKKRKIFSDRTFGFLYSLLGK